MTPERVKDTRKMCAVTQRILTAGGCAVLGKGCVPPPVAYPLRNQFSSSYEIRLRRVKSGSSFSLFNSSSIGRVITYFLSFISYATSILSGTASCLLQIAAHIRRRHIHNNNDIFVPLMVYREDSIELPFPSMPEVLAMNFEL